MSSGRPRPLTAGSGLISVTGLTLSFFLTVVNQLVVLFSLPLLAAVVAYSMFWLPQIARSALRGRTAALTTEYLVGTTICRMLFAFCVCSGISTKSLELTRIHSDFLGYDENILEITPRGGFRSVAVFPWLRVDCTCACCCSLGLVFRRMDDIPGLCYRVAESLRTGVLLTSSSESPRYYFCVGRVLTIDL